MSCLILLEVVPTDNDFFKKYEKGILHYNNIPFFVYLLQVNI